VEKAKALNVMPDGTCRTIKSQYYKNSVSNFVRGGHTVQQELSGSGKENHHPRKSKTGSQQ